MASLDAAGDVLKQFEARDRESFVFRYPVNKLGEPSLPESERINIGKVAEVANGVFALLDGCDSGFDECLQYKWEMEREYM
jgi:hypothetical protein